MEHRHSLQTENKVTEDASLVEHMSFGALSKVNETNSNYYSTFQVTFNLLI